MCAGYRNTEGPVGNPLHRGADSTHLVDTHDNAITRTGIAGVAEPVDAQVSKTCSRKGVSVRSRPPAPSDRPFQRVGNPDRATSRWMAARQIGNSTAAIRNSMTDDPLSSRQSVMECRHRHRGLGVPAASGARGETHQQAGVEGASRQGMGRNQRPNASPLDDRRLTMVDATRCR